MLIATLLSDADIRVEAIQHRVKAVTSLSEKLKRSSKCYSKLEDIPDLAGLRIIVHRQEDVDRVVEVVRRKFDVDDEESGDAAAKLAPHEFGYLSVHLVIRLSTQRQELGEWSLLKSLHAEVQIRIILQHAWASISHALQYNNEEEVPHALRRRLYRVSALLELADQEFATLGCEHRKLSASRDPKIEDILMVLQRVLRRGSHSCDWIREHSPLTLTDAEIDELIRDYPAVLKPRRIIRRDPSGKRVFPGKPGMTINIQPNEDG